VVIEAAGILEDAGQLYAARTHVVDVRLHAGVAAFKCPLFLGFAPEYFVVAVGVERRIDVDQIDARVRQLGQLFQIVAAIDDAGVQQRRRPAGLARRGGQRGTLRFGGGNPIFCHFCHGRILPGQASSRKEHEAKEAIKQISRMG